MFKFVSAIAIVLMMGCSNSGKKNTTVPPAPNAQAPTTTAATEAKTSDAPSLANTKSEKHGKNKKATKALATKVDADTAAASGATKGDVTCTSGSDTRSLAVKAKNEGCELEYTKAGQATSVASQIVGSAKCDEVSTRIQEKLMAAGFKCE